MRATQAPPENCHYSGASVASVTVRWGPCCTNFRTLPGPEVGCDPALSGTVSSMRARVCTWAKLSTSPPMYKGTKGENAPHTQTGRGDWALGSWGLGSTRDRPVRCGTRVGVAGSRYQAMGGAGGRVWAGPKRIGEAEKVGRSLGVPTRR